MAATPVPGPEVTEARRTRARTPARPNGPVALLREAGDLVVFSGSTLKALPGSVRYLSEALRHLATIITGTSGLLFLMYFFFGIISVNTVYFLLRALGAADFVGFGTGVALRVCGPVMFGYVFTAKVCGGIVAELGAMKINQEIAAYEATGVDPERFVVGTRILAIILYVPIATAIALVALTVGEWFNAIVVLRGLSEAGFFQFHWATQGVTDQLYVLLNILVYGVATAIVACFYGLRTTGGPAEVGSSVARAVIVNLVLVNLIGAFFVIMFYGTGLGLPLGG